MGYSNISEYAGGKKEWMESGLPVQGEARHVRPEPEHKQQAA